MFDWRNKKAGNLLLLILLLVGAGKALRYVSVVYLQAWTSL